MWFKKFKQKKLQYFLIALILMCITSIFTGCISFVLGVDQFSNWAYDTNKSPEHYFSFVGRDAADRLKEFDKETDSFEKLFLQEARSTKEKIQAGGKTITLLRMDLLGLRDVDEMPFSVELNDSIQGLKEPEPGTVWISSVFADVKGIQTGDWIEIGGNKAHKLKVAGTYNSIICPSASMAYYPFYINVDDMKDMNDLEVGYYGCFTRKDQSTDIEEFVKTLPKEFAETIQVQYSVESLQQSFATATILMAGIGIAASLLTFIVSIIIIRFIIKSNLAKEYKSIGVYKSIGYQSREIIGFYLKCYLLAGSIGVGSGALAGLPLAKILGSISLKYVGEFSFSGEIFLCVGASVIGLLLLLILNVLASLHKIKKMSPVKALTNEMSSSKSKFKRALIKNAHSPFSMAVNDIFKRKGTSVLIVLILTVSFYLSIFFMMVNITGATMTEHTTTWFAVPQSDCFVNVVITDEIKEKINESSFVKHVIYGQFYLSVPIDAVEDGIDITNLSVFSYSDFNESYTGVNYTKGRAPQGSEEVAFTAAALDKLGADVGDYVKLKINEREKDYFITGKYDSMMNGGSSIQVPNAALDDCEAPYTNDLAFVELNNESDIEAFKDEIENKVPAANVTVELEALKDATKSVSEIVSPIAVILVGIFISFSFLNIINLLLINNLDNKKKFGILKSLGFGNGYIMMQNTLKILMLSIVSIGIALGLHVFISSKLFYAMVSIDGLVNDIPVMAILIVGMLAMIVFTSLLFSIPLRKITPTELMEE